MDGSPIDSRASRIESVECAHPQKARKRRGFFRSGQGTSEVLRATPRASEPGPIAGAGQTEIQRDFTGNSTGNGPKTPSRRYSPLEFLVKQPFEKQSKGLPSFPLTEGNCGRENQFPFEPNVKCHVSGREGSRLVPRPLKRWKAPRGKRHVESNAKAPVKKPIQRWILTEPKIRPHEHLSKLKNRPKPALSNSQLPTKARQP